VFVPVSHFHPSLMFAGEAGAYLNGASCETKGTFQALPVRVKLGGN